MSGEQSEKRFSISEVAERTGVSTRTVRYYVQRGLIDPPLGRGRGSHYSDVHIAQINRVRRLQRDGVPLDAVGRLDEDSGAPGGIAEPQYPPPDVVFRIPLARGIRLELDAKARIPEPSVIDALARVCGRILGEGDPKDGLDPSHPEMGERSRIGGDDESS